MKKAKNTGYKDQNIQFLKDNASNPEVTELESGVQYKIIEEGNGAIPSSTSLVQVYYKGWLIDGREFDSNLEDELPAIFRVYEVIDGWQQILKIMPAGSTWEIYIPYKLGYGSRGDGMIKGFSTLIFQVKLVSVA